MKRIWNDYFRFTKMERAAVLLLALLMGIFLAAPYMVADVGETPAADTALAAYLAAADTPAAADVPLSETAGAPPRLFLFDPNTIDEAGWVQLGIAQRTAATILRYRNKGGRFKRPEDIRKIWGLPPALASRLLPFVRIPGGTVATPASGHMAKPVHPPPGKIDINAASEMQWRLLPGIGDILAARIVRYRERIGGFVTVSQVGKTYGITDSLFSRISVYLTCDPTKLPAVNINSATAQELRTRAAIPFAVANAIVRYRENKGPFFSVASVKDLLLLPDSVIQKLILRCTTN